MSGCIQSTNGSLTASQQKRAIESFTKSETTPGEENALALVQYFDMSRGAGHTRTVVKGLAREPHAHVIVDSYENIPGIPSYFKIPLSDLGRRLAGLHDPLVIDNYALSKLLTSLLMAIREVRDERYYAQALLASTTYKLERAKDELKETDALLAATKGKLKRLRDRNKKRSLKKV